MTNFRLDYNTNSKKPFASTGLGVITNTILGLPKAAYQVGKDLFRGVTRNIASAGLTLTNTDEISSQNINSPFGQALWETTFGTKPVQSAQMRIAQNELKIQSSPFAQKTGLAKIALPLAFGTVIGDIALDLTPVGGEKNAVKQLLKEGSAEGALKLLKEAGVADDIAQAFAPEFAKSKTTQEVADLLETLKGVVGAKEAGTATPLSKLIFAVKESGASTPRAFQADARLTELQNTFRRLQDAKLNTTNKQAISRIEKAQAEVETLVAKITDEIAGQAPRSGDEALSTLLTAIKEAGVPRVELDAAFTAERARRASEVSKVFVKSKGQAGYRQALGKLKGELAPKPTFEPLKIKQADVDTLFNQVQSNNTLDVYDKITASAGLQKLLNGELPQPSQLSLLEDIFGSDLIKVVQSKRPFLQKLNDTVSEVLNVPRSLITSFDMSAVLRQGVILSLSKPKATLASVGEMFRQTFSPKNFEEWFKMLPSHPYYEKMKDAGLYIANPTKLSAGLTAKEERFMTNLAQKIPLLGGIVRASERSYVSYLNKLRVDVFTQLAKQFEKEGLGTKDFKSLANFINNATGRGSLGGLERAAQQLNTVFFSPRLIASRFNMLNPLWYARQTKRVRQEAIKTMGTFIGTGLTIVMLADAAGAEVETDPRSSDFGKIRIENTRFDIWGGFQQWVRVFTQLATGERKSTTTGKITELSEKQYPFDSRLDVAIRFGRGKLAPIPSLAAELLEGQKLYGEDLSIPNELAEKSVPLYIQDMQEAIKQFGPEAFFITGIPSFFGVGTQTYEEKRSGGPFRL